MNVHHPVWVGTCQTHKSKSTADYMTFRNPVLTSIVANDEVHIGPKLERTEQIVTHEILESDAFNEADVSLEIHTEDILHLLMSFWGAKTNNWCFVGKWLTVAERESLLEDGPWWFLSSGAFSRPTAVALRILTVVASLITLPFLLLIVKRVTENRAHRKIQRTHRIIHIFPLLLGWSFWLRYSKLIVECWMI